jgi:hypothetical protein
MTTLNNLKPSFKYLVGGESRPGNEDAAAEMQGSLQNVRSETPNFLNKIGEGISGLFGNMFGKLFNMRNEASDGNPEAKHNAMDAIGNLQSKFRNKMIEVGNWFADKFQFLQR